MSAMSLSARSCLNKILRLRVSALSVVPEVDHALEKLHGITHQFNAPITTTILNTAPFPVNRGNKPKVLLVWYLSNDRDMVKNVSKYEHAKIAQRLWRFDRNVVRSHRFSDLHTSKAITSFVKGY